MKISTINIQNKYYNNLPAQKPVLNSSKVSDSFSFTGNYERLSRDTMEVVSSISNAYKDILKKISEKTPEGMEIIQKEYKDFKSTRSLMFHNCGENKTSIQVRVPDGQDGRDFIKIVVKKGSNFSQGKVVLDSYTIKDFDRIVEDNDKNHVFVFPQNIKYANFDKPFELKLQKVLDDLDCAMLKFRKFLAKYDGQYLKPELFTFSDTNLKRLANIDSLYNKTDELLKGLYNKLSLKIKKEFGDYKLQVAQPVHILKNIGENKNQIAYKKLQHPEHGILTRIMVYDKNDEIIDGFLLKEDQGLIVSNFNLKNFSIIPPKLLYHDKSSVQEILPKLELYISGYEKKLEEFNKFISQKLYERSLGPVIGKLSEDLCVDMERIDSAYKQISDKFVMINSDLVSKIKTSYPKWNGVAGQRGFTFKVLDNEQVSILKMKNAKRNNLTRLCFSKNGEDKFFLINQDMVVKNFNPKYPTIIPPELKYYSDIELEELGLETFLKKAADELQEFEKHAETSIIKKENEVKRNRISESKNVEQNEFTNPVKKEKTVKIKQKPLSKTKEYKQLMKECNEKLTLAMKNAENDLQGFNNVIQEIQSKIAGFFSKTEQ